VLLHVHPFQPLVAVPPPRWEQELRERLEARAAPLRGEREVRVDVKPGPSPVRALHEAAEEYGASLLVAGASRRAGIAAAAPGGVGERLLHAAPCAVAIAPRGFATDSRGMRRIGVAFVDGPEGRDALTVATALARRAGGTVTTYTVREPPRAHSLAGALGDQPEREADQRIETILDRVRASVPADILQGAEVLHGHAAETLEKVSGDLDLLICGSRGYGPVRSTLVGGVSSRLAHTAACPLLVIPRAPVPGLATLTGRGTDVEH
jgi:nucleotide-binding universal stress UspA family protein